MLCAARPDITVRVEFMARQVLSQAGNETSEDYETDFVRFRFRLCDLNVSIAIVTTHSGHLEPLPGDFHFCHHVIIISKPLQSHFF